MSSSKSFCCQVSDWEKTLANKGVAGAVLEKRPNLVKASRDSCDAIAPNWRIAFFMPSSESGGGAFLEYTLGEVGRLAAASHTVKEDLLASGS